MFGRLSAWSFSRDELDLGEIARLMVLLDELYESIAFGIVARTRVTRGEAAFPLLTSDQLPRPKVTELVKRSPLIMQMVAAVGGTGLGVAALRGLAAVLREPHRLAFYPRVRAGWYDGRAKEYQARLRLEALQQVGGTVRVDETPELRLGSSDYV